MNDDGFGQRRLTDKVTLGSPTTSCGLGGIAWSPRATMIGFTATCVDLLGDPRALLTAVYVVRSSGGSMHELVPDGFGPSFSADGRFVAFERKTNVIAPTFVGFVRLADGLVSLLGQGFVPAWSPTGHRLAFASEGHGVTVVDASRPAHRWTFANRTAGGPAWFPTGKMLAFSLGGARPGIYAVRPGGPRRSAV
jgi:WD40 repeat protein